ncbi:phosphatase PAP2 family protein [Clostridium sporogenes]|uniref:Inositol phosphorylceramide synthase n=1 Tax=Clostridium cochlearium TaxID=1494 RepID=A0A2X2WEG8_CLOCO|nr:phosphatase PAP2 family protein [Clostridium cochlearium]MBE6064636.1 inositol phosphorylceramide synthase [Clostridium cochlearium]MBU5268413.1 phosphatase PAP2 family protein [Clostridium cochlearium]MDU1441988.1 phosphatase PAP2 family protein [Clostridium cochlearium]NOH15744.1 inositol phosphorylceramide synthase [Clostridium cochlearium]SQB34435.1 Ser/Thr and Tyr protein phosphatase (dual specificity)\
MNNFKNNLIHIFALLSIPIINIFYALLNNNNRGVFQLVTSIDNTIPFIKEFIIPYILWYPFIALSLLFICLKDLKVYYRTLITLNLCLLSCYLIYYFFQTTVPRPAIYGNDIFSFLTLLVYKFDKPFNCFPSIHVVTSYLMIKGINSIDCSKKIRHLVIFMSILIIVSTLFIKQHVILDVISAILLGDIIFDFISKLSVKISPSVKIE